MSDAINRALASADRMLMSAKASVALGSVRQMTQTVGGMPYSRPDLAEAVIRDRYVRGHTYTAISVIAKRIAGQRILIARSAPGPKSFSVRRGAKSFLDDLVPLNNHPFLSAIHSPNQLCTKWGLMYSTVFGLLVHGTAFWWLAKVGGKFQIWPLPSSWMLPVDNMHSAWDVRPYGIAIEPFRLPGEDVAYFSIPDHANPFWSASPMSKQADAIEADESIQRAQARAFENGIFPGMAVIAGDVTGGDGEPPVLYDHQRNQIISTLSKLYQGVDKANSFVILDGLIKDLKPLSDKPAEMDFLDSGSQTKARIFEGYGVNSISVGSTEGANRAQAVVSDETLCENVLNPIIELMSERMDASVTPRFGNGLTAWIEPCRSKDKEMEIKEWENALKWGMVSRNEYRARLLGLPAAPGEDVFIIPVNTEAVPVDGNLLDAEDDEPDYPLEDEASGADESDKSAPGTKRPHGVKKKRKA